MANRTSGMPIATMSENKASSPEWLLQSVIEKLQHRVALRSLADANMQSSWSDLAAAFPGFGVPTESAGATQKFHPADSIHDPSILGSPEDPTGPMVRSWSYWKRTTWGFESPRTACKFMSMKAWAEILRAKECTALISGNVCFFLFNLYIYYTDLYSTSISAASAHLDCSFYCFSMLSLQVPPALTPRATNVPPLTAELGTKSASMKLPFLRLFPCLPQFPMVFHAFSLFFLTMLSTSLCYLSEKKKHLDGPWS